MSREDEIWEMSNERIREIQEDADSKLYIFQASLTDTDRAIINRVMQQRFELLSEVARLRRENEELRSKSAFIPLCGTCNGTGFILNPDTWSSAATIICPSCHGARISN